MGGVGDVGAARGGIAGAGIAGVGIRGAGIRGAGATGVAVVGRNEGRGALLGAASASDSVTARSPVSQDDATLGAVAAIPIRITAPQTEQRARIPTGGIFDGSTRNTELHSAHETFTAPPSLWLATPA